jgi:hypothetical protein
MLAHLHLLLWALHLGWLLVLPQVLLLPQQQL